MTPIARWTILGTAPGAALPHAALLLVYALDEQPGVPEFVKAVVAMVYMMIALPAAPFALHGWVTAVLWSLEWATVGGFIAHDMGRRSKP